MDPLFTSIKHNDLFGHPIFLTYKGQESHQSVLGGLVSIIYVIMIIIYVSWRFNVFMDGSRDELFTGVYSYSFDEIGKVALKDGDL